ncbi:MAG: uroporphyrinogen-III synthase [Candidatus Acidiferrales bacterium]
MSVTDKPLAGKRIVMTRAPEQAPTFFRALTDAGASVILFPCIEFAAPDDYGPLDSAISHLDEFDWLTFTSQNAVRFFTRRHRARGTAHSAPTSRRPKVAALGNATAEVATKLEWPPDFVASNARSGAEFVSALASLARGQRILLPQSDQADERIPTALREVGAFVTCVVAYRACMPKSLDSNALARIRRDETDMIFFASPSAFRNFAQAVGEETMEQLAKDSAFGAIGPTTAGAIRAAGVRVGIESPQPSASAIVKSMHEFFIARGSAKVGQ